MFWASKVADVVEAILRAIFNRTTAKLYVGFLAFVWLVDFCFRSPAGRMTVAEALAWIGAQQIGHVVALALFGPIAVLIAAMTLYGLYRDFFPRRGVSEG